MSDDVMDTLAGLSPARALAELRRQRPDVVKHLQGSDDAIFAPADDGGLTRAERAAAALRIATLLRDDALEAHYRARLAALDPAGALARQRRRQRAGSRSGAGTRSWRMSIA